MKRVLLSGIPIVALWLVAVGWLGAREGWWLERVDLPALTGDAPGATSTALRVELGGRPVGTIATRSEIHPDGRRTSNLEARLVVPLLGFDTPVDLDMSIARPAGGDDGTTITARARAVEHTVDVAGRLEGDLLRGTVEAGGETVPLEVPIDRHLLMAGGLGPLLDIPPLGTGERVRITAVDPLTLGSTPIRLRGLGFERLETATGTIDARVVAVEGRALSGRVWLDPNGDLIRAETPLGLTLVRVEDPE